MAQGERIVDRSDSKRENGDLYEEQLDWWHVRLNDD